VEAGYKALNVDVKKGTAIDATMQGPFVGLTGYW